MRPSPTTTAKRRKEWMWLTGAVAALLMLMFTSVEMTRDAAAAPSPLAGAAEAALHWAYRLVAFSGMIWLFRFFYRYGRMAASETAEDRDSEPRPRYY